MPARSKRSQDSQASLVEQLLAHSLDPLAVVMLTRERIQETLEDAVKRGRVTRSDANELAGELLRRGRTQTEELLTEMERVLRNSREKAGSAAGRRPRLSDGVGRIARGADRARRSVAPSTFAIAGYDELTARQVQSRLAGLTPGQLREVGEYELRHANRKTVLDAVKRALGD